MAAALPSLRLTRRYAASCEEVWAVLAEPQSLARWLGAPDVEAQPRAPEPLRALELDWQRKGEPESRVRIELTPSDGGTLLVLDHTRLDARVCMRYFTFWTERVERLVARGAAA